MSTSIGPILNLNDVLHDGGLVETSDMLTLVGYSDGLTLALTQALQAQFIGLRESRADGFIPVVSTTFPRINGFYSVESVNLDEIQTISAGWRFKWSVQLRKPAFHRFGGVEVSWYRLCQANNQGIGTWHFNMVTPYGSVQTAGGISLAGYQDSYNAEGPMSRCILSSSTPNEYAFNVLGYQIDPTLFYRGRSRIEQSVDGGTTWVGIVGGQMEANPLVRIGNGFVRFTPIPLTSQFTLSWWNGYAWTAPKGFSIGGLNGATWTAAVVILNTIDNVTVRFFAGAGGGPYICDVSLRRADRYVEIAIQTPGTAAIGTTLFESGSLITGALKASAFDGQGVGYILSCDQGFSSTGYGIIAAPSLTAVRFMVGATINGLNPLLYQDVQSLVYDFFGRDSVVSRLTPQ